MNKCYTSMWPLNTTTVVGGKICCCNDKDLCNQTSKFYTILNFVITILFYSFTKSY